MRREITIENFRGIAQGSLKGLAPLTVLVGRNNSGKSTILEALRFGGGEPAAQVAAELSTKRGWSGFGCIKQLAYDSGKPSRIALKAVDGEWSWEISLLTGLEDLTGELRRNHFPDLEDDLRSGDFVVFAVSQGGRIKEANYRSTVVSPASVRKDGKIKATWAAKERAIGPPCLFIDPDTITKASFLEKLFSEAVDRGKEQELEALLSQIDPTGPSLRILMKGDRYVLHTVTKDRAVAVSFAGDGFKRLLFVAFSLAAHAGELVLLEEPECFQHPAFLGRLAALMWGAVNQGTQVIISTHSLELLRHLFLAGEGPLEKAAVFHTRLAGGVLRPVRISGEDAADRLDELGEDLRQ